MHSASLRRHPLRIAGAAAACVIAGIAACSSRIADGVTALTHAATAKMPVKAAQPYFEFQVEKPVEHELALGAPVYPAELKAAKIEGEVLAQFVVDQSGTAEVATFKVLRSPHQNPRASAVTTAASERSRTAAIRSAGSRSSSRSKPSSIVSGCGGHPGM